jgi:hypothetical protein
MVSQEFLGEFIKETVLWKTFIPVIKLNRFLKIKLFPAVLGLLKYCFMYTKKSFLYTILLLGFISTQCLIDMIPITD